MEKVKDFVAIDMETANNREDICQIGIVVVKDGVKQSPRVWMVQPPGNHYDVGQMNVHHITPEDTRNSPFFEEVWNEVKDYLTGQILVSHNCHTEIRVLNNHFKDYGILPMGINMDIRCTCKMHGNKGLEACCQAYGMPYDGHHDAGFDADACAQFYLNYQEGVYFDESLIKEKTPKKSFKDKEALSGDVLKKDLSTADPNSPLYDRKVVITGDFFIGRKELGAILKREHGADIDTNISKNTNFVFIGENPGWKKLPKLDKLIHDGFQIRKLYEDDLRAILAGDWEDYHVEKAAKKDLDFSYSHFTEHRVVFKGTYNVIAGKELYYGKGLSGDRDLFAQITGNLGAAGDYEIYPETNLCVLSDSTIDKLKMGVKDETILYIQNYYNSNRAKTFELSFISENDIFHYVKERIERTGDESTGYYYKRYIDSLLK